MAALKEDFSGFAKVFAITSSFITSSPLVQWSEVQGQLGLVHCVHQNNNSVIAIAVKTDKILVCCSIFCLFYIVRHYSEPH